MIGRAQVEEHVEDRSVADRLHTVRARLADAVTRAGRVPGSVRLVAVSKQVAMESIRQAFERGQHDFAESKAQELRDKALAADDAVRWHFVGRLQRNKIKYVEGTAGLIHSIDSVGLAEAVAARAARAGRVQHVLVQVNVGQDSAKAGFDLDEIGEAVDRIVELDGLACDGLMTIPPMDVDPRPLFAALREARDRLRRSHSGIKELSMGMSKDFEVAVEEGATLVRLGEAVFGPRPHPARQ